MRTIIISLFSLILTMGCLQTPSTTPQCPKAPEKAAETLNWTPLTLDTVRRSFGIDKPIMIYFREDRCTECNVLENIVFTDPHVVRELRGFTVVKANAYENAYIHRKISIEMLQDPRIITPMIVLMSPNGFSLAVRNYNHYFTPGDFLRLIRKFHLESHKVEQKVQPMPEAKPKNENQKIENNELPKNK